MTNKTDTVLKAITDRITGELLSDMKLNDKSTSPVLSAYSYPMGDPQCPSHPPNWIKAFKTCSKETNHSQKDQLQIVTKIITRQIKEPEQTLEDKFKDLHLNLSVLEVLAHALMYNVILDKYVESLELGKIDPHLSKAKCLKGWKTPGYSLYLVKLADGTKSYPVGIVKDVEVHIGRLKLLNDFYVIDMKKDPETPLLVGRGFLATANAVLDCRKAKIAVGEGITSSDGVGARSPYYAKKEFMDCHLLREWEIVRDAEINPFKDVIVIFDEKKLGSS
ncbi:MAK10-like protein [Tanacetum coccineum]